MLAPFKTLKYRCSAWIFVLFICSPGFALAEPALSSVAVERLSSQIAQALEAQFDKAQQTDEIFPGATVAVVLPDGMLLSHASGYADTEAKIHMSTDARMPAGSIGKTHVAAVALSLVADGKLALDVPVAKWFEDTDWFVRLPNHEAITLRHLLNHSSGIIDHVFDAGSGFQDFLKDQLSPENQDRVFDPRMFVQFVLDQEPLYPAGEGFHYSDTGYLIVGMIIEKVTSQKYYETLSQRFLTPLELIDTIPMDRRDISGVAQGYAPLSHQLFGIPEHVIKDGLFVFHPSLEWTGGGLVSTTSDLVRWAKALYEGQALTPGVLTEMLTSVASETEPPDQFGRVFGYGLGVSVVNSDFGICYRHGGFFPGYHSFLAYYPDQKVAIAMQINTDSSEIEAHFDAITALVFDTLNVP